MDILNTYISKSLKDTINIISKLGSIQIFIIIILLSYTLKLELLTKQLIAGIIIMTLFAIPIRLFLFKERPKKMKYINVLEKIKASSFPSMHSARFGFIAISIYLVTKNIEIGILLLSIYIIIIIQRIYFKKHDYTDVIGGGILAIATIMLLTNIKGF
jgi:membrane-associated phospholipid phosphatase